MRRREFITLLGGAAVARPLAVRAQQGDRVRRIALLLGVADDREGAMAGVLGIAPLNNSSRFAISSLMNSRDPR